MDFNHIYKISALQPLESVWLLLSQADIFKSHYNIFCLLSSACAISRVLLSSLVDQQVSGSGGT